MRFLLKKPSSAIVAIRSGANKTLVQNKPSVVIGSPSSSGKAWGQQCSPTCGCVLRIETELLSSPATSSPTIVRASYYAKRVMATTSQDQRGSRPDNDTATRHLKPVMTQNERLPRPILLPCQCPTLHRLAHQTVEHLPGKTLAQLRNEVNMGMVGSRSTVAFRHTVLRETVMPNVAADEDVHNSTDHDGRHNPVREMNSTHCYDLVEDSLLSLIHERMPTPRKDTDAEAYSPTLGGTWRVYSCSRRRHVLEDAIDGIPHDVQDTEEQPQILPSYLDTNWRQDQSPASFSPLGSTSSGRNMNNDSLSFARVLFQQMKDLISTRLRSNGSARPKETLNDAGEERRPTTNYLTLLDMYGTDDSKKEVEESAMDDWLEYVDQMHSKNQSCSG